MDQKRDIRYYEGSRPGLVLFGREKELITCRQHQLSLLYCKHGWKAWFIIIFTLVTCVALSDYIGNWWLFYLAIVVLGVINVVRFKIWWESWICLTNHRLMGRFGWVDQMISMAPLHQVADANVIIPFYCKLLGVLGWIEPDVGHLLISGVGGKHPLHEIILLPNALAFQTKIMFGDVELSWPRKPPGNR